MFKTNMKIAIPANIAPSTKNIIKVEVNDILGCHFFLKRHAQIPISTCCDPLYCWRINRLSILNYYHYSNTNKKLEITKFIDIKQFHSWFRKYYGWVSSHNLGHNWRNFYFSYTMLGRHFLIWEDFIYKRETIFKYIWWSGRVMTPREN